MSTGAGTVTASLIPDPDSLGLEFESKAQRLADEAIVTVTDVATLERCVTFRQRIASERAQVVDFFAPIKQLAFRLHRAICDRESAVLRPYDTLDTKARTAIQTFKAAEDERRRKAERELAEQRKREEEARAAAAAAALEQQGDHALASAVLEEAIAAPAPAVVLPDATKVSGLTFRRDWKWRLPGGDTPEARARAMQLVPREFLCLDDAKISRYVKSMKETSKIPGIEVYYEDVPVRARS